MANPSQMTGTMVTSGHCPSAPAIAMMLSLGYNNLQQDYHAELSACAPDRHHQFHSAGSQHPALVPAAVHSCHPEADCSPQRLPGAVHQGHYLGVGILGGLQYRLDETDPGYPLAGDRGGKPQARKLVPGAEQSPELGGYPGHAAGVQPQGAVSEVRSEEHTSELQSRPHLVCRLLLENK